MIETEFSVEQKNIEAVLKEKVNVVKNIEPDTSTYKSPAFYMANGSHQYTGNVQLEGAKGKGGQPGQGAQPSGLPAVLPGAVVPEGFKHYTYCSCYVPQNDKYPRVTAELAEIEMKSEQEARFELAQMVILVRKQRLLWRTKEMCQK